MTDASAYNAIPRAVRSLYEPQLEQFGIVIRRNGEGWSGTGRSAWGRGSAWGMPVGDFCILFSHDVYMEQDMALVESPESAYACVCMVSEDCKATMPRMIDRPRALLDGSLYSFVQPAGSFSGRLHRGGLYSSRCICFLPQHFEKLDLRWPGAFSDMFERFGRAWDEAQSRIIMSALLIQARVEQMLAELAASCAGDGGARGGASARERGGLALEAQAAIERMLDEGRAPGLDELASMLFVSRSHLCAAFSRETGQSIGRYAKARRIERAKVLLASGDSVAYVAARLGWPRPSAFSQAFKQATGISPTEWRDAGKR